MSKQRKVETWTHAKTGLECDIFLHGTDFVATFMEETYDAPNIAILRKQLTDVAEHWISSEWHPVVLVSTGGDYDNKVELDTNRFWLSRTPAGDLYTVDWDCEPEHRNTSMTRYRSNQHYSLRTGLSEDKFRLVRLPLGAPIKLRDNEHMLDYTDELWERLESIKESIRESIGRIHQVLKVMVSTKANVEKLLSGNADLMLLGDKPKKK